MRQKALAVLISILIAAVAAGLILSLAIVTKNYSSSGNSKSVQITPPSNIGGLALVQSVEGEEALKEINKLHGKNISLEGGYVADYSGDGNRAQLWAGQAGNTLQAKFLINRMIGKIKQKGQPFAHQKEFKEDGIMIHQLSGMGQNHYVYQNSNKVVWLSVDPPNAKKALEDTLRAVE